MRAATGEHAAERPAFAAFWRVYPNPAKNGRKEDAAWAEWVRLADRNPSAELAVPLWCALTTLLDQWPKPWAPGVNPLKSHAKFLRERAFENREIFPDRRIYALVKRYLAGEGTLEALGAELGMTKQRFAYHVRRYQKELGLPPESFQMSEAARRKFCSMRRRGNEAAPDAPLKIRTWQAFKFARFVRETDPEKLSARELFHVAALVSAIAKTEYKFKSALGKLEKMNLERNPEKSLSSVESYCRPASESDDSKKKEIKQLELFDEESGLS